MMLAVLENVTQQAGETALKAFQGDWTLIIGAAVLVIAALVVFFVLKQVVLHAILGIIGLLVVIYVFRMPIPLSAPVILISVLGGLGGVAAVIIATYFGWL